MTERTKEIRDITVSTLVGWSLLFAFGTLSTPRAPAPPVEIKDLSALDTLLNKLDPGNTTFHVDSPMDYGETKLANLLLSMTKSIPELEQELQQNGRQNGIVQSQAITVADIMEAHLTGNDFDIVPITPEEQAISRRETTEWKWSVKPKDVGTLPLHLSLNAKFKVDGQEAARTIRTFDKTVYVKVFSPRGIAVIVRHNWQWLCTALIFPIAGWVWHRGRKSAKKKDTRVAKSPQGTTALTSHSHPRALGERLRLCRQRFINVLRRRFR